MWIEGAIIRARVAVITGSAPEGGMEGRDVN